MIKKFLACSIGGWLGALVSFLTVPIATRLFEPGDFGILSLFTLVTSIISTIIGMGMLNAYVRFFYEEIPERRNQLLLNCLKLPMLIFGVFLILSILFRENILDFLIGKLDYSMITCLILTVIFDCLGTFSDWTVRMREHGKLFSALTFLRKGLNFTLIISFYYLSLNDYKALIYALTATSCTVTMVGIFAEKDIWNFHNPFKEVSDNHYKHNMGEIIQYAWPFLFSNVISWLFSFSDRIAIKYFVGIEELGIYSAAFLISGILVILQNSITAFIGPLIMKKYESRDDIEAFLIKISNIVSFFMFSCGILLLLFKDIIIFLLGAKYQSAVYLMPLLILSPILYTLSETTFYGIIFKKKSTTHLYISIASSFVSIIGNLILVPQYGAKGAVIATALAWITFFVMRTAFSIQYFPVKYSLSRIGLSGLLFFSYALYLTFYQSIVIASFIGVSILFIIIMLYRDIVIEYLPLLVKRRNHSIE